MQLYILISIVIAVLAIGIAISLIITTRKSLAAAEGKYPQGHWMSVGIGIGIAIGVALGPIFDNLGVGIGIGVALGTAIGASLEQKNKDKIRPLTEQERARQKRSIAIGLALAAILGVMLVIVYFLQAR